MKKLATLIGGIVCLGIMSKPKTPEHPRIINNYFIAKGSSGGCSGGCGGNCGCGKH